MKVLFVVTTLVQHFCTMGELYHIQVLSLGEGLGSLLLGERGMVLYKFFPLTFNSPYRTLSQQLLNPAHRKSKTGNTSNRLTIPSTKPAILLFTSPT